MSRFAYYFWIFIACALAVLFAAYTGMALISPKANAAAPEQARPEIWVRLPSQGSEMSPGQIPYGAAPEGPEPSPMPLLSENGKVLFLGNSLVQGLDAACRRENTDFICKKGIALPDLKNLVNGRDLSGYDLIFIEMGSNELGLWSEENFTGAYGAILDILPCRAACLSIPPVCESKSRYAPRVSNANVAEYNSWISSLCDGRDDAVYISCADFFGDALDPGISGDGLHLNHKGYSGWLDWIFDAVS